MMEASPAALHLALVVTMNFGLFRLAHQLYNRHMSPDEQDTTTDANNAVDNPKQDQPLPAEPEPDLGRMAPSPPGPPQLPDPVFRHESPARSESEPPALLEQPDGPASPTPEPTPPPVSTPDSPPAPAAPQPAPQPPAQPRPAIRPPAQPAQRPPVIVITSDDESEDGPAPKRPRSNTPEPSPPEPVSKKRKAGEQPAQDSEREVSDCLTSDSESESSDPTYSPTAPDRNPFGACELSPGPRDVGPASAMEQEDMKDDELPSDDDSASDGDQSDYVPDNKI